MTYTLDTLTEGAGLGELQRERYKKGTGISPQPMPLSDSPSTYAFDIEGATATISITGRLIGTGATKSAIQTDLQTKIKAFKDIADGNQDDTIDYISDMLDATIQVKITSFTFEYVAGDVPSVVYTVDLIEAVTGI